MFLQIISEVYQIPKMLQKFRETRNTRNMNALPKDSDYRFLRFPEIMSVAYLFVLFLIFLTPTKNKIRRLRLH
jgi:hypothetical protein